MRLPISRAALVLLALLALAVGIDNLRRPLANPDEGRYSEISREMAASGDWVTPRLNGIKYFEKPPLQYWATAAAFRIFGVSESTARLYIGFCGMAALLIMAFTAWRLLGVEAGVASVLALVASPYYMALGGIVTLDMGLALWTTATLCALLLAENPANDARTRRRWMLVAWAAMALAVLSKGLVGIVFPSAAIFLHMVLRRDLSILRRLEWRWGLAIFLALAAPWFVAVSSANPEFARFFFVHEHFERFLTTEHRRVAPAWTFVAILFAGFLPWMLALPAAIAHAWRREAGAAFQPLRLAILWSAFILAFFSASSSKLPAYILPMFPALGLVLGAYLAQAAPRRLALWQAFVVPVALGLAWAAWRLPAGARDDWTAALYRAAQPWAVTAAVLLLASSVGAIAMLRGGRRWAALATVAVSMVLVIECLQNAYEEMTPRQSGKLVAHMMAPLAGPATRIYSVNYYEQTVPFYLGRTVTLVDYTDEFDLGLKSEPGHDIPDLAKFPAEWLRPGDALAIMHPGVFEKLKAQGLPMQVLHEDPRRVLVRKP